MSAALMGGTMVRYRLSRFLVEACLADLPRCQAVTKTR